MLITFSQETLSRLPAESRAKAAMLDYQRQAAHAAFKDAADRLEDASRGRDAMELQISSKIAATPADRRYPDEIEALLAPLKIIDADLAGLKAEVGRADRAYQNFDFVHDAARSIGDRGRALKHKPLPGTKGDPRKIVDEARVKIEEIQQKIMEVELAPAPAAAVRDQIIAEVDKLANQGRPSIDARSVHSIGQAIGRAVATPAFAIFAARDAIIASLTADLVDAPGAMTDAEKADAIAKLEAERFLAERQEEAAIVAAAEGGTTIIRRRGVSAAAILELEISK